MLCHIRNISLKVNKLKTKNNMSALKQDLNIAPQEIYANSVLTSGTDIGARMTTGDGRVFRYALGTSTALVAGKVYQSLPQDTTNWQNLAIAAAGTLTNVVTTTTTVTLTANQLAGGSLGIRDGANGGQGFSYKIKSHPAATAAAVAFTLEDPLQIGLTTGNHIDVTPNPYASIVVAPTALTGTPVGVSVQNGTATGYAWIQTRGLCNVLSDGAITVGRPVTPSIAVAGALMASTSGTQVVVGVASITTTDQKYAPFLLSFE